MKYNAITVDKWIKFRYNDDTKNKIMQAIATQLGVGTKAHSVTFSMPVDGIVGINLEKGDD